MTDSSISTQTPHEGPLTPLAVRPAQAAQMLGISPRKLWELTNRGEVPHAKLGRATLYRVSDLEQWLANLSNASRKGARQ